MYSILPSFVLGFHGCDREVGESILEGKTVPHPSENDYDWLGDGIYFWENNPDRALSYAKMLSTKKTRGKGKIQKPFVIGAIIDLGKCLNLTDENALLQIKSAYDALDVLMDLTGEPLPENKPGFNGDHDLIKRHLDCAVIKMMHALRQSEHLPSYETVRSPFFEGAALHDGSGFREKAHIQIAVRNLNCIKGYFRPLNPDGPPLQR